MTPRRRVGRGAVAAAGLALLVACASRPRVPFNPARLVQRARVELQQGDLERAEALLAEARRRAREHGTVRLWLAKTAAMRWRADDALRDLAVALDAEENGGWSRADICGEIGDLLFRVGRYGESVAYLQQGQVGDAGAARRAWSELALRLPYTRRNPEIELAELPLLEGDVPRLLCAVGSLERVFVLDTGASFTTLSASMAAELGVDQILDAGTGTDGTGQRFPTSVGRLPAFALGAFDIGPQPVLVLEDARLSMRDAADGFARAASALVGLDVITRFRTTLDPVRGSVVLQPPRGLPEARSEPCLLVEDRLLVPVEIEQRRLWFALDTGASTSSLTQQGLELLVGGARRAQESYRAVKSPGGGRVSVRVVRGLALRVSDVRFRGVDLPVVEREPPRLFPLHGVLGADLLLRGRITMDSGRMRMEAG